MPQIECPSCQTRHFIPAQSLPEEGRKVRCASCKALWIATPASMVDEDLPPPETIEAVIAAIEPAAESREVALSEPEPAPVAMSEPVPRAARPWQHRLAGATRPPKRRFFSWQAASALAVAAALMLTVGMRKSIVSLVPDAGKAFAALGLPVNLRGLEFRDIKSGIFVEEKTELLVVQGEIVNVSKAKQPLPRLKFSVRDAKGIEIYTWTAQADGKDLQPGEALSFRRRLASPPPEGTEVLVRFATRADLVAMGPAGRY